MTKRKLLEAKASLRRGRRCRKTRYRHPKWRPKTKRVYCEVPDKKGRHWQKQKNTFISGRPEEWLPPSLQSKTDHHIRWIKKLQGLLPEWYRLSIELGRFDPARMKDPEIHGNLYQKGPQYDYENVRAYVLDRDRYTCQVCRRKGRKLHVHHILYRSQGLPILRNIWPRYAAAAIPRRTTCREVSCTSGCRNRRSSPGASGMPHS